MSQRSPNARQTAAAGKLLGDARVIAFIHASKQDAEVSAGINTSQFLEEGGSLNTLFEPVFNGYGYWLEAEAADDGSFNIRFGCQAGPTAGDGGSWVVRFDEAGQVSSIEGRDFWIS